VDFRLVAGARTVSCAEYTSATEGLIRNQCGESSALASRTRRLSVGVRIGLRELFLVYCVGAAKERLMLMERNRRARRMEGSGGGGGPSVTNSS
jgi:hypothetical protein